MNKNDDLSDKPAQVIIFMWHIKENVNKVKRETV
jgi:hypothetical protein